MRLLRESAQPMYVQLKAAIVADIVAGHYQPHQQLPSERELCQRYDVSRMTVRQALIELAREGAVYTRIGKGTFVSALSAPQADKPVPRGVRSFSREVRACGCSPSSRVLEATVVPAPAAAAHALQIAPESDTILLVRVRLADGGPRALETVFLPFERVPDLLRHDFRSESLCDVLEHTYTMALVQTEQTVEAALADAREADVLALRLPAAVLKVQRLIQRQDGPPIAFALATYCGDYYKRHATL
jgi:GntR family transcriptional regulator